MALELTQEQKDAGWQVKNLGDITSKIGSGATPRGGKNVYLETGAALIRSQNVHDHKLNLDDVARIDENAEQQLKSVLVQNYDVLMNITGDSIARCAYVPQDIEIAYVNQHVSIIRTNPSEVNYKYLQKYLVSPKVKKQLLDMSDGGTRKALTKGALEGFEIVIPPIGEQKRIAEILGSLDDKIEANSGLLDSLDELIRLEYLSSSDSSELKISDVSTEVKDGVSHAEIADNEVYVGLEHLPRRNVWLREWGKGEDVTSSKSRFKRGDILFGKLRPYFHKVVVAPVDGICSTDIIVVRPEPGFETLALQALSSDEVVAHATNASNGTRMPRTKWADLKDLDTSSATGVLEPSYIDYAVSLIMENQRLSGTRDHLIRHLIG